MYPGYKFNGHRYDVTSHLFIFHFVRAVSNIATCRRNSKFYRDSACRPYSFLHSFRHLSEMRCSRRCCHIGIRHPDMRLLPYILVRISSRLHHNTPMRRFSAVPVLFSHLQSPFLFLHFIISTPTMPPRLSKTNMTFSLSAVPNLRRACLSSFFYYKTAGFFYKKASLKPRPKILNAWPGPLLPCFTHYIFFCTA